MYSPKEKSCFLTFPIVYIATDRLNNLRISKK
jgi:hypothetical protein